jgi:sigma-B regulation protein RsbU (phosphoserine phosphatase)
MMARTHALFRSLSTRPDASQLFGAPERAVGLVNDALAAGNSSCMFVTLLLGTFDVASGRLTYVRAGHVPPFLRRATGVVERLREAGGPPLGLVDEMAYKSASVDLHGGDQLLVVTDGITEAADPAGVLFGDDRASDLMAQLPPQQADLLVQLRTQVRDFEAGRPQFDDIAAILLTIEDG